MPSLLASDLASKLAADYPDVHFVSARRFAWDSRKQQISYQSSGEHHELALLHELGHALLKHTAYVHDIELIQLELAAWEKARELAKVHGVELDEDYAEDCLDTYRDWLHLRATCPTCLGRALQANTREYRCFNCQATWSVSRSRLCRPYRLQKV